MIEKFKEQLSSISDSIESATEDLRVARAAYEENKRIRAENIAAKLKSLQVEIDAAKAKISERAAQIVVLAGDNSRLADEIEAEIDKAISAL